VAAKVNNVIEHSLLDKTYRALADSTRRGMLVTLRDGPARITDMAAPLRSAEEWIAEQVSFWSLRADALAARLERRNPPVDRS